MAEYWFARPEVEEEAQSFLASPPEPEMSLDFDIPLRDFVNAGNASAKIKSFLKKLGVAPPILRRAAVSSYEAEINVTAHSKGGTLRAMIYTDRVYLVFQDTGPGMRDINQAMTPGWSTADEQVREMGFGAGMGLPNIKKNSDAVRIVSAENASTTLEILIYYNSA